MKKTAIILVCIGSVFLVTWVVCRVTHVVGIYNMSSTANLPTFHPGDIIVTSRLKTPGHNTFVCFRGPNKRVVWVFRCIGTGGDMVEIRDAKVYLNGKLLVEPYTWNEYYISTKLLNTIRGYVETYKYPLRSINDSLNVITISAVDLKTYHLNLKMVTASRGQKNDEIFGDFKKLDYNEDNLGPIRVPEGCYFLLGDSRHDAFDSRYLGFVKRGDIVSTVLFH